MNEYWMNIYGEQLIMLDVIMKKMYDNANKLFVEYIGMEKTDSGWFDAKNILNLPTNTHSELLFHVSYDWLISVYNLITKEELFDCKEQGVIYYNILVDSIIDSEPINEVYLNVYRLLEYYKKEKLF